MGDKSLTYQSVNRDILATLSPPGKLYWLAIAALVCVVGLAGLCVFYQMLTGMGVTGLNNPVGWGTYIITFVFWVGIAHSGTLISAVLFLFRAKWRTAVYRVAEAMTIFAVLTAGLFPLIHLGRIWRFYFLLPYPNQRQLWPNFMSPLVWDVFAVSTYLTVSLMFFYLGLIPDLAAARDRASGWRRKLYGMLSMGWNSSSTRWQHYRKAYLLFAAIATPLVVSVHSVVSWDFAMSIIPGWHATIFAPYFVAGAIHSGLAMVITLMIPIRKVFKIGHIVTVKHLEAMAKIIVVTGIIVAYSYATEYFIAAYSGNQWEQAIFAFRPFGTYAWAFWTMVSFNTLVPLLFLFRRFRTSIVSLMVITILINIGMWFERFVIIVTSLAHDFLPYAWGNYAPSVVEFGILAGSFAWFFLFFLLFIKHMPSVSMTEVKEVLPPPEKGGVS